MPIALVFVIFLICLVIAIPVSISLGIASVVVAGGLGVIIPPAYLLLCMAWPPGHR